MVMPFGCEDSREIDQRANDLQISGKKVPLDFPNDRMLPIDSFGIEDTRESEGLGVNFGKIIMVVESDLIEFGEEIFLIGQVVHRCLDPIH